MTAHISTPNIKVTAQNK